MHTQKTAKKSEDKGIDIIAIVKLIWEKRLLFIKNSIIVGIIGVIIVISIPRKYTSQVVLAPETVNSDGLSSAVNSIASLSGFDLGSKTGDAIYPELYPSVIGSTSFLIDLFDVKVVSLDKKIETNLYDYMKKYQKHAWWSYALEFPSKMIKWIKGNKKKTTKKRAQKKENGFYHLNKEDINIASMINNCISCEINKKTQAITIAVKMQDPVIAATITEAVRTHLQNTIIKYRTNKARTDLAYITKLYNSARVDYEKAQTELANFMDRNLNIVSARYKSEEERLRNQMELVFAVYTQSAQQMQIAKAKVQEKAPVYSIIQPTVVPIIASYPKRMITLFTLILLTCIGTFGYIIIKTMQKDKDRIFIK